MTSHSRIIAALQQPRTAREVAAHLYRRCDGRTLWAVLGAIDNMAARGDIVRCGERDGVPLYVAAMPSKH